MNNLRIATWNIKSNNISISKNNDKANIIIDLLKEDQVDILALQEVSPSLMKKIETKLKKEQDYKMSTVHNKTRNPIKKLNVKYNIIISRIRKTTTSEIDNLPTNGIFKLNKDTLVQQTLEGGIIINNTELEDKKESVNKQQLDKILQIIECQDVYDYKIFLAGDLSCLPNTDKMISFTSKLSELGININQNTQINSNNSVDYIFVPNYFESEKLKVTCNYRRITPNQPLLVEVKEKKAKVLKLDI